MCGDVSEGGAAFHFHKIGKKKLFLFLSIPQESQERTEQPLRATASFIPFPILTSLGKEKNWLLFKRYFPITVDFSLVI